MKRIAVLLSICLVLSSVCFAEETSANRFLSNLSETWDSFLDMAEDAGKEAYSWAEESGIVDWVEDKAGDIAGWARENGLTDWAEDTLEDIISWFDESGISDWAEGTSQEIQDFIMENRPAIESWLSKAGEEVQHAWDVLVNADQHTQSELEEAYDVVTDSLKEMAGEVGNE